MPIPDIFGPHRPIGELVTEEKSRAILSDLAQPEAPHGLVQSPDYRIGQLEQRIGQLEQTVKKMADYLKSTSISPGALPL